MNQEEPYESHLHYLMSLIGGFLGAYALLNRGNVFGSAQTANLITITFQLIGHNFYELLIRIGALVIYGAAIVLAIIIPRYSKINMKLASILCTMLTVLLLGFLPADMNPIIALYPVFFVTAFQWSVFKGAQGYLSSPIFSTNNFKQMLSAFTEYCLSHEEAQKKKARFYGLTLLSFHIGVGISFISSLAFGVHSSFVCFIPLGAAFALISTQSVWAKKTQQIQETSRGSEFPASLDGSVQS